MHERAGCWHSSCVIRPDGTDHGRARARSAREGRAEVTEIDKPTLDEFAARIRALGFDPPQANLEEMYAALPHIDGRSEEHTSELQSLMRSPDAVFRLKKHIHIKYQTSAH